MGALLGRSEKRQFLPEPVIPPFRGANAYGQVMTTPDMAMTVPTVWACVALLSNAVSMLPLETFERRGAIAQRVDDAVIVTSPAATMTQSEWLHMLMVSALLRGNAYGQTVERDRNTGLPTQIEILNPDNVRLEMVKGRLLYWSNASGTQVDITGDMWHVRGLTMPGSKVGLSPVSYAAATLGIDLSARKFAQDFYTAGGIPTAVLTSDRAINQGNSRTLKEKLREATRNREPLVLGEGLTYQQISVNPDEAQFLATQQATVAQIARFFGVPAGLVGGTEGGSMTYSNVEQRSIDFLTFGVQFWLRRIEDAMSVLLPPRQFVRFNVDALLRTDAETQAKVANQAIAGKWWAPMEERAKRNLPPMSEEAKKEVQMVPLEITPLGGVKAIAAAGTTPPDSVNVEGTPVNA